MPEKPEDPAEKAAELAALEVAKAEEREAELAAMDVTQKGQSAARLAACYLALAACSLVLFSR